MFIEFRAVKILCQQRRHFLHRLVTNSFR